MDYFDSKSQKPLSAGPSDQSLDSMIRDIDSLTKDHIPIEHFWLM